MLLSLLVFPSRGKTARVKRVIRFENITSRKRAFVDTTFPRLTSRPFVSSYYAEPEYQVGSRAYSSISLFDPAFWYLNSGIRVHAG